MRVFAFLPFFFLLDIAFFFKFRKCLTEVQTAQGSVGHVWEVKRTPWPLGRLRLVSFGANKRRFAFTLLFVALKR